jgi:hypothetical protein
LEIDFVEEISVKPSNRTAMISLTYQNKLPMRVSFCKKSQPVSIAETTLLSHTTCFAIYKVEESSKIIV